MKERLRQQIEAAREHQRKRRKRLRAEEHMNNQSLQSRDSMNEEQQREGARERQRRRREGLRAEERQLIRDRNRGTI